MTQRHYDIYVESVWNCASSKACSSVYLLDRAIGCCGMITTFTFGKKDGNQAEMLRTATLAALNRTLSESVESGSKVSLYINCGYVRNVLIQKRYQQWQNNGWETEQGRPCRRSRPLEEITGFAWRYGRAADSEERLGAGL